MNHVVLMSSGVKVQFGWGSIKYLLRVSEMLRPTRLSSPTLKVSSKNVNTVELNYVNYKINGAKYVPESSWSIGVQNI